MVTVLKNKCSVWKTIKFPTFWYNCYYFTWWDTYFIQLETLLINHPSYLALLCFPFLSLYSYNWLVAKEGWVWVSWNYCLKSGDTRWHSCLRYFVISCKGAGSVPDGVIGMFHWHHPSDLNMALESASKINECQEYFPEVKAAGA